MPTPAEKKALVFLAAVAVAGATVRATGAAARAEMADDASREALRRQIVAVESAGVAGRKGKHGGGSGSAGALRSRDSRRNTIDGAYRASPSNGRTTPVVPPAVETDPRSIFAPPPVSRGAQKPGRGRPTLAGPIDVDVATAEELERLPRIGPAVAERIVQDRAERGAFGSVAGLARVRGIGPAMARELAAYVTFSGTPRPSIAGEAGASAASGVTRKSRVPTGLAPERRKRRPVPP